MKKILSGGLIILSLGIMFGYTIGRAYKTYEINLRELVDKQNESEKYITQDKELVLPNRYAPKVSLSIDKDPYSGYNLKLNTTYFYFSPITSSNQIIQNTGFANIFINNKFIGRAYTNVFYINSNSLQKGKNLISVTLNAGNGKTWWSKNGTLEAKSEIEINN